MGVGLCPGAWLCFINDSTIRKIKQGGWIMKKAMVMATLILLVGATFANAQGIIFTGRLLDPDMTGPFTVTLTDQKDNANGGRTLVNKVKTVGGGSAHMDITLDDVTDNLTSIDIYGYTKQPQESSPTLKHIVSCPGSEFLQVSDLPGNPVPFPHIENLRGLALCAFNPNGLDGVTDGIAYFSASGYSKKLTDIPADVGKFVLWGSIGGAFNQAGNSFVFKGSFGSVLKPPAF
jgi:hypothetical protein